MYTSNRLFLLMMRFARQGALPAALAATYYASTHHARVHAIQYPSTKERIRGEYENKIRRDSPPEKIFETFATVSEEGRLFMTHYDLFKAICPYNYAVHKEDGDGNDDSAGGDKKGDAGDGKSDDKKDDDGGDNKASLKNFKSKALLNFADIDGDGKISLYEYFLIVCLIQISRDDIKRWFAESARAKDDLIDLDTLRAFYEFAREKSRVKLTITQLPDPRRVVLHKPEYDETLNRLLDKVFSKYPQRKVPLRDFLKMREDFLEDIYRYEFETYSVDADKTISGEDFAKSIICFLDVKQVQRYMRFLKDVDFPGRVSFEDYYVFHKFLQENMETLQSTIQEKGAITRNRLAKLIEEYQKKLGLQAHLDMIDIFIRVLDFNNSKKIESEEFFGVVKKRQFYGAGEDNSLAKPFLGLQEQTIVWINKAERIWNIICE